MACRAPKSDSTNSLTRLEELELLSNGLQAMLFTVCWRYLEEKLNERAKRKLEEKKAE